jgi:hypothetical protein
MIHARGRAGAYVLLFFLCFFVLFSSGRIASADAGQQLQASMMLALTGRLGDDGGGPANEAWVRAPNGRRYESHDLGNIVMMLPAAWIGARLSSAPDADDIRNPPVLTRVLVSLTCAALAAVGCYWLFSLFALYSDAGAAFLLAVAFPTTTVFIAYARTAWDVLGGAVFVCGVLCASAAVLRGVAPARSACLMAAALAGACSFRFSLAPFLLPAAAVVLAGRGVVPPRARAISAAIFVLILLPSLAYNFVRTGSPLTPATAAAQYLQGANALTGSIWKGLYGLFVSPNKGLFLFSPVLLLAFLVPLVWRRLSVDQRRLLICYGLGSFAYVLLIAKMENWGAFGWGPRYLVPVLPVAFIAAAMSLHHLQSAWRPAARALVVASAVLSLPPAVVNWHLATTAFDGAADPDAAYPYQQVAAWRTLSMGVQGIALPLPVEGTGDPSWHDTGVFPDLLLARVARYSRPAFTAAVVTFAVAVSIAALCMRRVLAAGGRRHDSFPNAHG